MKNLFLTLNCNKISITIKIFILMFFLQACKKDFVNEAALLEEQKMQFASVSDQQMIGSGNGYCWEDAEDGSIYDSILKPTILGAQLIGNPYIYPI